MKQRIITGIILACLFILPFWFGGVWFSSFALLAALLAYTEWLQMAKITAHRWLTASTVVTLGAIFVTGLLLEKTAYYVPILAITALIYLLAMVFQSSFTVEQAGVGFIGFAYIVFGFMALAHFRLEEGFIWTLSVLLLIITTDTGAYFIGKKWGKTKLAPNISPNKTMEGAMGGILVAIILSVFLQSAFQPFEHYLQTIFLAVIISASGQLGDLIESAVKRHYQVKDSGKLLPGHGGVLDRTDSWIFVCVVLVIIQLV